MISGAHGDVLLASLLYLLATTSLCVSKELRIDRFPSPAAGSRSIFEFEQHPGYYFFSKGPNNLTSAPGGYCRREKVVTVENKNDDGCIPFPFNVSSSFSAEEEIRHDQMWQILVARLDEFESKFRTAEGPNNRSRLTEAGVMFSSYRFSPNNSMFAPGGYRHREKVGTVESKNDDMCIPFPFNVLLSFSAKEEIRLDQTWQILVASLAEFGLTFWTAEGPSVGSRLTAAGAMFRSFDGEVERVTLEAGEEEASTMRSIGRRRRSEGRRNRSRTRSRTLGENENNTHSHSGPVSRASPPPAKLTHYIEPKVNKVIWIASGASSVFCIVLLGYCINIVVRRRKKLHRAEEESHPVIQSLNLGEIRGRHHENIFSQDSILQEIPLMGLAAIQAATDSFSDQNKLGEGGFGPVYKGRLAEGQEIAVKRLSETSGQGIFELANEVALIAKLQHRNIVTLLGCCLEQNEKLLVYEYMPNKSLDMVLFDPGNGVQLDCETRLKIVHGVARGLLYLHEDSRLKIIHRDLKASNILLDDDMNPKISDFGMARTFGDKQIDANTNRVAGTYGYMAPEYAMEGIFSMKSDVYSFGVLVLEIISGRKNSRLHVAEPGQTLLALAWKLWSQGRALELMDASLKQSYNADRVLKCIHIGLLCVQQDAENRPSMSLVVVMLGGNNIELPAPTEPTSLAGRAVSHSASDEPLL